MGGRAKPKATGEQRGSSRACVCERSARHASNELTELAVWPPQIGAALSSLRFCGAAAVALQRRASAAVRFEPNPPSTPAPP